MFFCVAEDEWIAKVDVEAFKADIKALGDRLSDGQGEEDVRHLQKIIRWSNICGAVGVASMWMAPNPLTILALSTWTLSRCTHPKKQRLAQGKPRLLHGRTRAPTRQVDDDRPSRVPRRVQQAGRRYRPLHQPRLCDWLAQGPRARLARLDAAGGALRLLRRTAPPCRLRVATARRGRAHAGAAAPALPRRRGTWSTTTCTTTARASRATPTSSSAT